MSKTSLIYAGLYLLFTFGDAWSSKLGLAGGTAQEFNSVMADEANGVNFSKFWLINIGVLIVSTFMLEWALRTRNLVTEKHIRNPLPLSVNFIYLNPFAAKNRSKAVVHWMAMAISFLLIKPFAIINNLQIVAGGKGLLSDLVVWLSAYLSGGMLYMVAISFVIIPLWIGTLYLVAYLLKKERMQGQVMVTS